MTALDILNVYIQFFEKRDHKRIENSSLVPQNDPTTLFTSSGMQPIIKYLLGQPHPEGKRLVNVQNCFRAQDIDEIGDNRHTTFFRMLGNWSLGDYFKSEEIPWFWEFLVSELKLDPKRLYVSVFEGYKNIERDEESVEIWKELFKKAGIESEGRIFYCGVNDNWWSRSGTPDDMPEGEPGGPDTEVYFDFRPEERKVEDLEHEVKSGRLLEIGNSVFMTYQKKNGSFVELPQKNVDFGGGLERLVAATEDQPDIFKTSLFKDIITSIRESTGLAVEYGRTITQDHYPSGHEGQVLHEQKDDERFRKVGETSTRIIADHITAATFIIANGVVPSNKAQGYILRRLIRRSMLRARDLGVQNNFIKHVVEKVISSYRNTDPYLEDKKQEIIDIIESEENKFRATLDEGLKEFEKYITAGFVDKPETTKKMLDSKTIFKLYETFGFPYELSKEEGEKRGIEIPSKEEFDIELQEHQQKSREGAKKKFNN